MIKKCNAYNCKVLIEKVDSPANITPFEYAFTSEFTYGKDLNLCPNCALYMYNIADSKASRKNYAEYKKEVLSTYDTLIQAERLNPETSQDDLIV